MIISANEKKVQKRLRPKIFKASVSIFTFIASDDDLGIVLYKNNGIFAPQSYSFDVEQEKKLKFKTFQDIIFSAMLVFKNNREYIKLAQKKFEDDFLTKIRLEDKAEIFELCEENGEVCLKKNIICIIKSCEEIEHLINPEFVRDCVVLPSSEINEFLKNNHVAEFCLEFLSKSN